MRPSLQQADLVMVASRFGTERDPSGDSPTVDPEGDPGQDHHQHGGEVGLQHEEEDVPPQDEVNEETVVPA